MPYTVFQVSIEKKMVQKLKRYLERLNVGYHARSRFIVNLIDKYISFQIKRNFILRELERRRQNKESFNGIELPVCPFCSSDSEFEMTAKTESKKGD